MLLCVSVVTIAHLIPRHCVHCSYKVFLDVYVHSPQFALVREVLHSKPPRFDTVLDK